MKNTAVIEETISAAQIGPHRNLINEP